MMSSLRLCQTCPTKYCMCSSRSKMGRAGSSGDTDTRPLLRPHHYPYLGCLSFMQYRHLGLCVLGRSSLVVILYNSQGARQKRVVCMVKLFYLNYNDAQIFCIFEKIVTLQIVSLRGRGLSCNLLMRVCRRGKLYALFFFPLLQCKPHCNDKRFILRSFSPLLPRVLMMHSLGPCRRILELMLQDIVELDH